MNKNIILNFLALRLCFIIRIHLPSKKIHKKIYPLILIKRFAIKEARKESGPIGTPIAC